MPPSGSCCHLPVSSARPHFRLPFSCRKKYSWYSSLLGTEYYYTIIKSANDRTVTDLNKTNINFLLKPYKIPTIFWEQIQGCLKDQICSLCGQWTFKRAPRCTWRLQTSNGLFEYIYTAKCYRPMRQNQVLLLLVLPNCSLSSKVQARCWEQFTPWNDHKSQLVETAPGLLCPLCDWLPPLSTILQHYCSKFWPSDLSWTTCQDIYRLSFML